MASNSSTRVDHKSTVSPAQARAQTLSKMEQITTDGEARQRLNGLFPPLRTRGECDELLEALESEHDEGKINLQTYRVYADSLMRIRPNLPETLPAVPMRSAALSSNNSSGPPAARMIYMLAYNMINPGVTAAQAAARYGITHPRDLAGLQARQTQVANQ